ncbi:MAG TPA: YdcF family protein [Methylomirabilota bacterium]|nr:YdcF family protein [Methylomirabilota bacterium]
MGALQVLGAAAISAFLLVSFTPAANVLSFWTSRPVRDSRGAQAIVVLGAGGVTDAGALTDTALRGTMDAVALYQKGLAPVVVFSGSPRSRGWAESEVRADLAGACGVPRSAILTSGAAHTTYEEALQMRALLGPRGISKIVLIADPAGMIRARAVFEHAGFEVIPAPAADGLDLGGSPEDRYGFLRQLAIETLARLYYRTSGQL